jgi:hypothetical protein
VVFPWKELLVPPVQKVVEESGKVWQSRASVVVPLDVMAILKCRGMSFVS